MTRGKNPHFRARARSLFLSGPLSFFFSLSLARARRVISNPFPFFYRFPSPFFPLSSRRVISDRRKTETSYFFMFRVSPRFFLHLLIFF